MRPSLAVAAAALKYPVITMVPLPVAYLMAKALLVAHGEHVSIVGKLGTIWL